VRGRTQNSIISDCWAAYGDLDTQGYAHRQSQHWFRSSAYKRSYQHHRVHVAPCNGIPQPLQQKEGLQIPLSSLHVRGEIQGLKRRPVRSLPADGCGHGLGRPSPHKLEGLRHVNPPLQSAAVTSNGNGPTGKLTALWCGEAISDQTRIFSLVIIVYVKYLNRFFIFLQIFLLVSCKQESVTVVWYYLNCQCLFR
jgi:hypothetical protein